MPSTWIVYKFPFSHVLLTSLTLIRAYGGKVIFHPMNWGSESIYRLMRETLPNLTVQDAWKHLGTWLLWNSSNLVLDAFWQNNLSQYSLFSIWHTSYNLLVSVALRHATCSSQNKGSHGSSKVVLALCTSLCSLIFCGHFVYFCIFFSHQYR